MILARGAELVRLGVLASEGRGHRFESCRVRQLQHIEIASVSFLTPDASENRSKIIS